MTDIFLRVGGLILFIAAAAALIRYARWDASRHLEAWAKSEGLELLSAEIDRSGTTGFGHVADHRQVIFQVRLRAQGQNEKKASVRVGHAFLGMIKPEVKVIWLAE